MRRFDAVVIGAGLAGLSFADELSRHGHRVALVDRKRSLRAPVQTTGIFVRKTFEDFPFPESLLGPPVRDVVLYSPSRRPLLLASARDEFRLGDMGAIYEWLAARCRSHGVVWMPSAHFVGVTEREVVIRRGGREERLGAEIVVGADGCASRVAAGLGLDRNAEWIVGAEEILSGVPLDGPPRFECVLDPRIAPGYLAWLVHDGREVHLGVGGYPSQFYPARALATFRSEVARRFDLSYARTVERRGGRIPVGGVLRRIASDRGMLVGDAAGAVSPLTAGGLDGAIRLSKLAARVASLRLESGDPSVLETYSGDLFRARFLSRRWMRRAFRVAGSPALIEACCALLRTPPGRAMAWQLFFGRGSFPDVEIVAGAQRALQAGAR
jgi:flavin-dependent dehydrogenase